MLNIRRIAFVALSLTASTSALAGAYCEGKADGTYAHPESADQFMYCAANGLIEAAMACPGGLLWNDDAKYCDWPENVVDASDEG